MQKNVASQKWIVFAFDETDNTAKTGDAAQITAEISKDGAAGGGNITDVNPTELEDGYYVFDITQAESNADLLLILPESSTGNIQVIGVPAAIYTTEPNRNKLSVDSNGRIDIIKIAGTTQTANDNGADINGILTDTGEIGTAGAGLSNINLPNQTMDITGSLSGSVGSVTADVTTDSASRTASKAGAADVAGAEVDVTKIHGSALTESVAGYLAAAFIKLFDVATPLLVASDVMVGTDGANTTTPPTVGAIQTEMEENGASLLDTIRDELANATDGLSALKALIDTAQADLNTITGTSGVLIDTNAVDADALSTDAITEIWAKAMQDLAQGAPSATASVLDAINWIYEAFRNKTLTTASLITIMKDNGTTALAKSTISDDSTTFTKNKFITGA